MISHRTKAESQHSSLGTKAPTRLKIAYLYPRWKPGRHSYAMDVLGKGLATSISADHEVTMLAMGTGQDDSDVPVRFVGASGDRLLAPLGHRTWPIAQSLHLIPDSRPLSSSVWAFPGYTAAVAREVRQSNTDVVHIHIYEQLAPIIKRASPSTAVVLHMHDHSQLQQDHAMVHRRLQRCDVIGACSHYLADAVRERFPDLADKIIGVPNAIPSPPHQSSNRADNSIVFVGRLSPEKGVHVLVEAFGRVAAVHPEARLILIGHDAVPGVSVVQSHLDSPAFQPVRGFFGKGRAYRDHLEGLVAPEHRDRVDFAGGLPNAEALDRLRNATVLALPSIWNEPFGMPVLEAMNAGLPVVATRMGAFPEIIEDGTTGNLVDAGDVAQLADALSRILSDPALSTQMGRAGQERAEQQFSWAGYVAAWDRIYRRVAT